MRACACACVHARAHTRVCVSPAKKRYRRYKRYKPRGYWGFGVPVGGTAVPVGGTNRPRHPVPVRAQRWRGRNAAAADARAKACARYDNGIRLKKRYNRYARAKPTAPQWIWAYRSVGTVKRQRNCPAGGAQAPETNVSGFRCAGNAAEHGGPAMGPWGICEDPLEPQGGV